MAKNKKSIIPGFSWNRLLGVTKAKQQIARATGIPTTKQGMKRKIEHMAFNALIAGAACNEGKEQPERPNSGTLLQNNNSEYVNYINECASHLNNIAKQMGETHTMTTYYGYVDAYIANLDDMIAEGAPEGLHVSPDPKELKDKFLSEMPERTNKAISRAWIAWQEKALLLKTEKGQKTRIKSFFTSVMLYADRYDEQNIKEIERIKNEAAQKYGV